MEDIDTVGLVWKERGEGVQVRAGGFSEKSKTNRQKQRDVVMDGERDKNEWWRGEKKSVEGERGKG